jgi:hypothetical protein
LAAQGGVALPDLPVGKLQGVLRANGALFSGATTPATPGRTA